MKIYLKLQGILNKMCLKETIDKLDRTLDKIEKMLADQEEYFNELEIQSEVSEKSLIPVRKQKSASS